ncbi:hypothetical protein STEG23_035231, partial [Scotinomys teguina]
MLSHSGDRNSCGAAVCYGHIRIPNGLLTLCHHKKKIIQALQKIISVVGNKMGEKMAPDQESRVGSQNKVPTPIEIFIKAHVLLEHHRRENLTDWTSSVRPINIHGYQCSQVVVFLSLSIPILDCHHTWCCCGTPSDFYCATQT